MSKRPPIVAIDGPAGAGKSTVAKTLARRLGLVLLDTGALYRTVALVAERDQVAWDDEAAVSAIAIHLAETNAIEFVPIPEQDDPTGKGLRVMLHRGESEDISLAIRTSSISMGASRVSAIPGVRDALLDMQRSVAERGGVVAEGRDIGTVVFPNADAKFFLTASPSVRATRRKLELDARGEPVEFDVLLDEVRQRDKQDSERAVAPLKQADDALLVDSTGRTIEAIVDDMVQVIAERTA